MIKHWSPQDQVLHQGVLQHHLQNLQLVIRHLFLPLKKLKVTKFNLTKNEIKFEKYFVQKTCA